MLPLFPLFIVRPNLVATPGLGVRQPCCRLSPSSSSAPISSPHPVLECGSHAAAFPPLHYSVCPRSIQRTASVYSR